jgi:pullulanase
VALGRGTWHAGWSSDEIGTLAAHAWGRMLGAWFRPWQGPQEWCWKYYTFRVRVYCPWTRRIEVVEATDPYSRSLAADGVRSQVAQLHAAELKPEGWDGHPSPPLCTSADISLYELHVRDFRWLAFLALVPGVRAPQLALGGP